MTPNRPPLPARWEFHLVSAVVSLLAVALQLVSRHPGQVTRMGADPRLRIWLDRRRADQDQDPSRAQLNLERNVFRFVAECWLAGRAYRFERAARNSRSSGRPEA